MQTKGGAKPARLGGVKRDTCGSDRLLFATKFPWKKNEPPARGLVIAANAVLSSPKYGAFARGPGVRSPLRARVLDIAVLHGPLQICVPIFLVATQVNHPWIGG